ncbi:MAG TPA: RNA polymerase sigma factor [Verrucomicrobiales bacterium]|nr:RNA polymerase sigma factor [Verrucomicrobiales bacterium]
MTGMEDSYGEPGTSDAELLQRCVKKDEKALAELVTRYQQRLYGLALRVSGDSSLAEEAAVDSFYKIWSKARQWRGSTSAEAWIDRIAVHTVLDLKRSRLRWWKRAELAGNPEDWGPAPEPATELAENETRKMAAERLERAIRTLKHEDRLLVHLYYFEERELKEIETLLDVPHPNLKMRLARARKKLRRVLEEDNHDQPD